MANVKVTVDASGLNELAENIDKAKRQLIGQLAERGYQLLRREVPVATGNLKQGVATPDVDYENLTATLTVSARSARRATLTGQIFEKGKPTGKIVRLKPRPAFNYAEAVARGRPEIKPKGKALLIPINGTPLGRYVQIDGQNYIYARKARATKPNPFDQRAAEQLEKEAPKIADAILSKFFE